MKTYFFPASLTLHINIEYNSAYLSSLMFLPSPWTHKMRSSEFSLFATSFSAKQGLVCTKQGWKLIPWISTIPIKCLNFGSRVINITQIQAKADLVTTTIISIIEITPVTLSSLKITTNTTLHSHEDQSNVFSIKLCNPGCCLLTSTTVGRAEVLA